MPALGDALARSVIPCVGEILEVDLPNLGILRGCCGDRRQDHQKYRDSNCQSHEILTALSSCFTSTHRRCRTQQKYFHPAGPRNTWLTSTWAKTNRGC